MIDLYQELKDNSYPGRGIVIGLTPDEKSIAIAYFIMGRSENSRNRVFITENSNLRTRAFDETKLTDPSLIIYYPVRTLNDITIVSNGDQTDTIYEFLSKGKSFEEALNTRTFEPDKPNFTPRISGIVDLSSNGPKYKLSILKTMNGDPNTLQRFFFQYDSLKAGTGHFIHTYNSDGEILPSFTGEPKLISTCNDIESFSKNIWYNLNQENKVSLFVRYINIETKSTETRVTNTNY